MRSTARVLDHYRVLGLNYNATHDEIKKAFRRMAKTHHPDANSGSRKSSRQFQLISEAHTVLSDPAQKSAYDISIGNRKLKARAPFVPPTTPVAEQRPGKIFDHEDWTDMHFRGKRYRKSAAEEQAEINQQQQRERMMALDQQNARTTASPLERVERMELLEKRQMKDHIVRRLKERRASRNAANEAAAAAAASPSPAAGRRQTAAAASAGEGSCVIS